MNTHIEANHSRAYATGQAYENVDTLPDYCNHAEIEYAEVTPGLNYGYTGYCKTCGLAGWEPGTPMKGLSS